MKSSLIPISLWICIVLKYKSASNGVDHSVRRWDFLLNRPLSVCIPSPSYPPPTNPPLVQVAAKWRHRMCTAGGKIYGKQSLPRVKGQKLGPEICVNGPVAVRSRCINADSWRRRSTFSIFWTTMHVQQIIPMQNPVVKQNISWEALPQCDTSFHLKCTTFKTIQTIFISVCSWLKIPNATSKPWGLWVNTQNMTFHPHCVGDLQLWKQVQKRKVMSDKRSGKCVGGDSWKLDQPKQTSHSSGVT